MEITQLTGGGHHAWTNLSCTSLLAWCR
jgi:hypothetical protein